MKNRKPNILSWENIVKIHETEYKCQNLQKTILQSKKNKYIQKTSEYTESDRFLPKDVGILI